MIHAGRHMAIVRTAIPAGRGAHITIRGYYKPTSGCQQGPAATGRSCKGLVDAAQGRTYLDRVISRLRDAGYDGSLLKMNDLLLAMNSRGEVVKDRSGEPDLIVCNFETLWKIADPA
jgi:hypothetical protein